MPRISLMMHTASCDNFLENQGIKSYFAEVTRNLTYQTFKDFEFIYVDTFYEDNAERFAKLKLPFVVKHVPVHKDHRYWYDRGHVYISAAKNTGILYADGTLCITVDDSEFFPDNFLEKYYIHFETGCFMHALHKRMRNIKLTDGLIDRPIQGEIYVNDHRFKHVTDGVKCHKHGSWMFAGTSFALKDALILNGFNERMDGCKSLEDCDFGGRLAMLGRQFSIDPEGFLYILDHQSYGDVVTPMAAGQDGQETSVAQTEIKRKTITSLIAIENYGMLKCAELLYEITANRSPITDKHLEIIRKETLHYRGFDPLAPENAEKFSVWSKVPTFDLKAQRSDLRKSKEWKW